MLSWPSSSRQQLLHISNTCVSSGGSGGSHEQDCEGQEVCGDNINGGAGGGGTAGGIITGSGTTTGDAASTDVDTTGTTDEGNQFTGELAIHIQEACLAAHNNDIPGVLLHLNLALEALNALRAGVATNVTAAFEEGGLMLEGRVEDGEVGAEEEG